MGHRALSSRTAMLASFAGTSVINYAFGVLMGWLLLPGDFGLLAFVQTVLLIAGLVLNSGFAYALTTSLVRSPAEQHATLVRGALIANLLLATGISAVLLALFGLGPLHAGFEQLRVALLVAMTLPLLGWVAVVRATAQGKERFDLVASLQVTEMLSKAVAGVTLVRAGMGVTGAIGGFFLGGVLAGALGLWFLRGVMNIRWRGPVAFPRLRVAGGFFGALLTFALLLNLDLLALKLGMSNSRALIGQYQAAIVLANMPYYLAAALFPLLLTRIARVGSLAASAPFVGQALRLTLLVLVPIELVIALAPDLVLSLLFPPTYTAGSPFLRLLALGNCAVILVGVFSVAFQATQRAGEVARILGTIIALEAAVLYLIVPRWHALGAAIAFCTATLTALFVFGLRYAVALSPQVRQSGLRWLFKYVIVIVAACLICAAIPVGYAAGLAPILASCAVYAAGIVVLRLITLPQAGSGRSLRW